MLFGRVSDVRCGAGRVVLAGSAHGKRQAGSDPRHTQGLGGEARRDRLAHVPPHVPFVAGRDRSSDEGAAGIDASCLYPDDDEYLWTSDVVIEAGSEREGRRNGAQANCSERLKPAISLIGSLWEFVSRVRSL